MLEAVAATIYTIGHSNQPQAALLGALHEHGIEALVDVRFYPMSRRNPQFNREPLAAALAEIGIEYRHAIALGGRRTPRDDSTNTALRNDGFRGFADHMAAPEFLQAFDDLLALGNERRVAIMCAESVPWQCHRSLISDTLTARGIDVQHIVGGQLRAQPHVLTAVARIEGGRVSYPALL